MKNFIACIVAASSCVHTVNGAVPSVSGVTVGQDPFSRVVTVGYRLDAPAIVTMDVLTNGVSIGAENLRGLAGDVNRLVEQESGEIKWVPHKEWNPSVDRHADMSVEVKAWATNAPPEWMVVDLRNKGVVNYYVSTNAMPVADIADDVYKTDKLLMRKIPSRFVRWRQGASAVDTAVLDIWARHLLRFVTLTHDYYIGVYQVTQRQYELMMTSGITTTLNSRPSDFKLESDYATRPVGNVSYDAVRGNVAGSKWPDRDRAVAHGVDSWTFMYALRRWTGLLFDLPTEAQWEFAARGGMSASSWYWGNFVSDAPTAMNRYMRSVKNYGGTSINAAVCTADQGTAKVGSYLPNAYGLYDMYGNVREWCLDWQEKSGDTDNSEQIDPVGSYDGELDTNGYKRRMSRGGGFRDSHVQCNSVYRNNASSNKEWAECGFRLALPLYR